VQSRRDARGPLDEAKPLLANPFAWFASNRSTRVRNAAPVRRSSTFFASTKRSMERPARTSSSSIGMDVLRARSYLPGGRRCASGEQKPGLDEKGGMRA
jgi:hypothetical protein